MSQNTCMQEPILVSRVVDSNHGDFREDERRGGDRDEWRGRGGDRDERGRESPDKGRWKPTSEGPSKSGGWRDRVKEKEDSWKRGSVV